MVLFLALTMSVRLLSDPDLGTHLNGGKWIAEHHAVPQKDFSTYTVRGNEYIDVYWLFQLMIFGIWSLAGYKALSLLVAMLSLLLFMILYFRSKNENLNQGMTIALLLYSYLVIEPRFILRPELFTLIFISLLIYILDQYMSGRRKLLFIIPVIMLVWCNMQGLFMLGLIVMAVYFISKWVSDKKPDPKFGLYLAGSILVCLVNPYFIRGFLFPFELFTRLEGENIFHQHIRELTSVMSLDKLVIKDFLFITYTLLTIVALMLTFRRRKLYEWALVAVFLYLSLTAIRNIPLFIVISFPVFNRSFNRIKESITEYGYRRFLTAGGKVVWWLCIAVPVLVIPRMITNEYYRSNSSNSKTGLGIDCWYQPVRAAEFLNTNASHGRIMNSLAFGGWLEWSLQRDVFIDGRLEVMKEPLYLEVVESWKGNLQGLINKYKPGLMVYNYLKYYPWTIQLMKMPEWKLVYIDGFTAIYALNGMDGNKPELSMSELPFSYGNGEEFNESQRDEILKKKPVNWFNRWVHEFYIRGDNKNDEILNIASFCLQTGFPEPAEKLFLQYLNKTDKAGNSVYYALADIYRSWKLREPSRICYDRILSFDPDNITVRNALNELDRVTVTRPYADQPAIAREEAVKFFNQGNDFFKNRQADKALSAYNEAIRLNPGYIKALNNRGILKASSYRQFREAIADFSEAIRLDPVNAEACLGRGSCFFQLNKLDSACKDWKKAYKLGNQGARLLLEQHCGKQGNY